MKSTALFIFLFSLALISLVPQRVRGGPLTPEGVTAFWPFDEEPEASEFKDLSGSFRLMTCSGAGCPASGAEGARGSALEFNGSNGPLVIPGSRELFPPENSTMTIACWFKWTDINHTPDWDQPIFVKENNSGFVFGLYGGRPYGGEDKALAFWSTEDAYNPSIAISTRVQAGRWYHTALTYDGRMARLYLDGQLAMEDEGAFTATYGDFHLGGDVDDPRRRFSGLLDDVILSTRCLSGEEVAALYDSYSSGGPMPDSGNNPDVQAVLPQITPAQNTVQLIFRAPDPDFDVVRIDVTGLPSWARYDQARAALTWLSNEQAGTYDVSVTATDSGGRSSTKIVTIPVTGEVWLAKRLDSQPGAGTEADPFDAGTQDKFDKLMKSFGPYTTVHIGPGTFETKGYHEYLNSLDVRGTPYWSPKPGWKILGSGMDVTVLRLVIAENEADMVGKYAVIGSWAQDWDDYLEVSDMTLDSNLDGLPIPVKTKVTTGGLIASGSHILIRRVKFINYGSYSGALEAFALIGDAHADYIVEDSTFTQPAGDKLITQLLLNGSSTYYPPEPSGGEDFNPIVRRCFFDGTGNEKMTQGISVEICNRGLAEFNHAKNMSSGFYQDTGHTGGVTVRNNHFENVAWGIQWNFNTSKTQIFPSSLDEAVVEDNQIELDPNPDYTTWVVGVLADGDTDPSLAGRPYDFGRLVVRNNDIRFSSRESPQPDLYGLPVLMKNADRAEVEGNVSGLGTNPRFIWHNQILWGPADELADYPTGRLTLSNNRTTEGNPLSLYPPMRAPDIAPAVVQVGQDLLVDISGVTSMAGLPSGARYDRGQFRWKPAAGQGGRTIVPFNHGQRSLFITVDEPAARLSQRLSGYWMLNDSTGTVKFLDSSVTQERASCPEGLCPKAGVPGRFGTAARFDGSQTLSVPNDRNQVLPPDDGAFSLSFWFNASNLANYQMLLSNDVGASGASGFRCGFRGEAGNMRLVFWSTESGGDIEAWSNTVISPGQWHHAAVSYDGVSAKLYLNGVQDGQTGRWGKDDFGRVKSNTQALIVGGGSGWYKFEGILDDLAVWQRALTAEDAQTLYRQGDPFYEPPPAAPEAAAVDVSSPAVRGITVTGVTAESAVVGWESSEDADGAVEYGTGGSFSQSAKDSSFSRAHALTLTGLLPDTPCFLRVRAEDRAGNRIVRCRRSSPSRPKPNASSSSSTRTSRDKWGIWRLSWPPR
ncbi:MAG: hypothetical protein HY548_10265 [Elusimicrobia bacterium]|nr:hypothetical protein [Elusimicrobiota bacterium]